MGGSSGPMFTLCWLRSTSRRACRINFLEQSGESSIRRIFRSAKNPFGDNSVRRKFHSAKIPSAKIPSAKIPSAKFPDTTMEGRRCPKCFIRERPELQVLASVMQAMCSALESSHDHCFLLVIAHIQSLCNERQEVVLITYQLEMNSHSIGRSVGKTCGKAEKVLSRHYFHQGTLVKKVNTYIAH